MTEQEAQELRKRLEEHYGRRVCPVEEYCEAFEEWLEVADDYLKQSYPELHAQIPTLRLVIEKSAALLRFVHMGEPVRVTPCPKHKGHWSGIPWPSKENRCACMDAGGQLTGWLPVPGCKEYEGYFFDRIGKIRLGDDGYPAKKEDGTYDYIELHKKDTGGVGTEE